MITMMQFIFCLAVGRVVLGLVSIFAIRPAAHLLGVPEEQNNPTARLFARLFGVRDIGLGVLVMYALQNPSFLRFTLIFNAVHDLFDAMMIAVPLVRRDGIDRAAWLSLAFALTGGTLWVVAWSLL